MMHTLYRQGKVFIAKDGLITVKLDEVKNEKPAISVPYSMYPGLAHAIHIKTSHPSKTQFSNLMTRYFYTPGYTRILDEVYDNCTTCVALKKLPKELFSESTKVSEGFAAQFSADVLRSNGQMILLIRENLTQFVESLFLENERSETLEEAILVCIARFIPDTGATLRVDCVTSFQKLVKQNNIPGSPLSDYQLKIELGRTHNPNKNPIAENLVKEFEKETLRIDKRGGPICRESK